MGKAHKNNIRWIASGVVGAALAAAFIWNISAYQTQSTLDARSHAQDRSERADERISGACSGAEPGALVECVAEEMKSAREDQRAEYDLSAQNRMAEWAFWVMIVTAITAGLTAVALWFIKETLDETRRMVSEAKDATAAANQAVTETSRVGEAQVRAYLSAIGLKYSSKSTPEGLIPGPEIHLVLNNSGATPAVNVGYFCGCEVSTFSESHTFTCPEIVDYVMRLPTVPANITKQEKVWGFGIGKQLPIYKELKSRVHGNMKFGAMPTLILWGSVFYDDVFGTTYRSDFSFRLEPRDNMRDSDLVLTEAPQRSFQRIGDRQALIKTKA